MSTPSKKLSPAGSLLQRQLKEINTANDLSGISVGLLRDSNVFEWEVSLMINDDCKYYGGMYSSLPLPVSLPPSLSLSLSTSSSSLFLSYHISPLSRGRENPRPTDYGNKASVHYKT